MTHPTPEIMKQGKATPWYYLAPALIVMAFFILYPMVNTISLSFQNGDATTSATTTCVEGRPCWGIFENYRYALLGELDLSGFGATLRSFSLSSYGNNIKWILLMVTGTVGLGLLIAVLADRVRYEPLAKAIIFMPMAISFVGAGVIWRFVYDFGTQQVQIGLLNAIITKLGGEPVAWLATEQLNTIALIVVGVWLWTGFCMTVLSASLKSVPTEILEAARVDGANEWIVFWRVMVPIIMPTIVVVITTMVINVLKIFDIPYVMTGGNFGSDVMANRMYEEMYVKFNVGRGTAVAVVLILVIIPFLIINVRRFREQEAIR
ncbi:MAG: sugar ABC transporter permease [Chloroflexi bacterium]|nr:sugar ABC transporter permease [Chloroflexota bacterium]MCI0575058.1 sugar ABC transporter permease [Chloroflexota bacterium]MCI0643584.1 sugar ABC transporter permease [Chloroflexota bacterium]MCI0726206.1 sugar ABC transporter permease [Chloroflexota bacterium]